MVEDGLRGARVVVTGASGLMGLPLALELAKHNDVTAVARFRNERDVSDLRAAGARIVTFDLADPDLSPLPSEADVVFHFGGMTALPRSAADREFQYEVNVRATGRLALRYGDCRSFVYASSGSTYLYQGERPLTEEDPHGLHNGLETYAASKIAAEQLLHFLSRQHGIPVVLLRIFSAYGPRGGAISARVDRITAGQPVLLYPGVRNFSCPMYETDYVDKAIAAAALASVPPETINFAGSENSSLEDYCEIAGEICGRPATFEYSPDALYPIWPDTSKMQRLLGSTKVPVREGIRRVIESGTAARNANWSGWLEPAD